MAVSLKCCNESVQFAIRLQATFNDYLYKFTIKELNSQCPSRATPKLKHTHTSTVCLRPGHDARRLPSGWNVSAMCDYMHNECKCECDYDYEYTRASASASMSIWVDAVCIAFHSTSLNNKTRKSMTIINHLRLGKFAAVMMSTSAGQLETAINSCSLHKHPPK